ncbi:MAG: hypothetical protein IAA25_01780 [Candidatus Ruminococcus intestinipullorum]|nr:hypothetical protein [Candidatus Ruminococcus intestinipullorum]
MIERIRKGEKEYHFIEVITCENFPKQSNKSCYYSRRIYVT